MPFQQKPANLRPLPMRVTQRQYDRLLGHRERDHISIQEHVRRALDNYLDLLDRKMRQEQAAEEAALAEERPLTPAKAPPPRRPNAAQQSKLVMR